MNIKVVDCVDRIEEYDCLIVSVRKQKPDASLKKINKELALYLDNICSSLFAENSNPQHELLVKSMLPTNIYVLLISLGDENSIKNNEIEQHILGAIFSLPKKKIRSVLVCCSNLKAYYHGLVDFYTQLSKLFQQSTYQYHATKQSSTFDFDRVVLFEPQQKNLKQASLAVKQGKAIGEGINYSRELSDLPANICTPVYLSRQAISMAQQTSIKTTVLDETEIKKLNMNLLLAVSSGSEEPPKFITMNYQGAKTSQAPIVLIGKGVTFDSGGYSIKSAPKMDEMKFDMSAAAAVMATMLAVEKMKLAVNLIAVIPASENLIDGGAFKPGDVLTSMSGQTVEILSTDAEGRLLIADALTYVERYQPSIVIDVATLTGACITALGYNISGLMGNDQQLVKRLLQAGNKSRDHVWSLPLWQEYSQVLDSNFADMASSAGRDGNTGAGAIVAGSFLSKFAGQFRWAHLDIAGPAWSRGKNKGASGRPVPLLCQFILDYCKNPF